MTPEPLEHILLKKQTFPHLWALLAPKDEFRDLYPICRRRWEDTLLPPTAANLLVSQGEKTQKRNDL